MLEGHGFAPEAARRFLSVHEDRKDWFLTNSPSYSSSPPDSRKNHILIIVALEFVSDHNAIDIPTHMLAATSCALHFWAEQHSRFE
ncbi:hypothetical protein LENED_010873 [Lentinula edodes]|uniref:Uncharacterized protein n=1 Tax=Lentinula edodes TaxID=5353 RepID=A0A1Q3ENK2_LENED|nr:hypothetical protein LENED_010873 [Lentinula edodes]